VEGMIAQNFAEQITLFKKLSRNRGLLAKPLSYHPAGKNADMIWI
jgi:hypothetical protein